MAADWITPDWPAPATVRAVSTTRSGGVSKGAYASFNLGAHVGDDPRAVAENRLFLRSELNLSREPRWLKQVHGGRVVNLTGGEVREPCDAAVARSAGEICVIMTADCLPVLFCDRRGETVAAAHCGWRSLTAGILENTLAAMRVPSEEILAWLGPAIGPDVYQVGDDVRAALTAEQPEAEQAFEPQRPGRWLCDLCQLASQRLRRAGVTHIYGGGFCTYSDRERFFSYRRDGECGRMANLIWIEK
ncbi:MAG: peptidoglycan editing factor PgeF [Gammaproteobacteria bacterium]|nr:peptidoglycan editing factor PgeF [Gammaproteobacteria bacterium]MDE2109322.1 peptidoglycan editing factor PgeF [Gammaproteobacteria bacterium]